MKVKAGPQAVGVAFLQRSLGENTRRLQPFRSSFDTYDATGMPHIRTLSITGPFNPTGPGDTPSRRRIFVVPAASEAPATQARRRARRRSSRRWRGARIASRRPTPISQRLLDFYRAGRRDGTFETGIQRALQRILASPKFVIRVEHEPPARRAGRGLSPSATSSWRRGCRSSSGAAFRTTSCWTAAAQRPAARRRPCSSSRCAGCSPTRAPTRWSSNFAGQWLQLRNLRNSVPNEDLFPEFDDNLRQAFQRETELFFGSIVREDRSVLDLLTADYTFVNERLAKHYGIPNVYGSHFRRVTVTDEARRGLLGQGSILTLTSNANRTSPTVRGKWILANLLGMPPSPPPADVPPLKENPEGRDAGSTSASRWKSTGTIRSAPAATS